MKAKVTNSEVAFMFRMKIQRLTTISPELQKFLGVLEPKTSIRAPNWLIVMVTKHPIMNPLYLWLVTCSCFLILRCSLNITYTSPSPSNILWNPSNLRICSSQVSRNSTHTSRNAQVRYTHAASVAAMINGRIWGKRTGTVAKKRILCASSTEKAGSKMYARNRKAWSSSWV